ncbi:MAG: cysteine desulfurase family protein [Sarcina sp.]
MIYLDNCATTPVDPEVLDAMLPYLKEEFGNPSSRHYTLAKNAEVAINIAREQVAALINAKPEEIIFTSCATESNNMILKGVSDYLKNYKNKGNHIITSKVEHKSVLSTCKFLNGDIFSNKQKKVMGKIVAQPKIDRGFNVTFLDVKENGTVSLETFKNAINENTILASIMHGNNELGTLNDIKELSKLAKENNFLLHSDATQTLGKVKIDVNELDVDFLSFSAHKIYGPKGIGAAFIRKNRVMPDMTSLLHGGGQEFGYRSGTHSVHNIVGFGKACEIAKRDFDKDIEHLTILANHLKEIITEKYPNAIFIDETRQISIPGVISVLIPELLNERYLAKLADKVAISAGSACSIGEPSFVIDAIGKTEMTSNFLRFSVNKFMTIEDLDKIKKEL